MSLSQITVSPNWKLVVHLLTWNDALARYSRHVWRSRTTLFRGTRKDTRQSWTTHASFLRDHERKFSIHDSGNYGGNHGRCVPCSRIVSPRALSLDHARFSGLTAPSSNRSSSCVERSSSPLSPPSLVLSTHLVGLLEIAFDRSLPLGTMRPCSSLRLSTWLFDIIEEQHVIEEL